MFSITFRSAFSVVMSSIKSSRFLLMVQPRSILGVETRSAMLHMYAFMLDTFLLRPDISLSDNDVFVLVFVIVVLVFGLKVFKLCGGIYGVGNMQFENSITIDTKSFICVER